MNAIYLLIPISLGIAVVFLCGFIWAVRNGQYEDTCTPALRVLADDARGSGGSAALNDRKVTTEHER